MAKSGDSSYNSNKKQLMETNRGSTSEKLQGLEKEILAMEKSPYKQKEKHLLDELKETLKKVEDEGKDVKLALGHPLGAKLNEIVQAIQDLDEEHLDEKNAYKAAVLLAKEEEETLQGDSAVNAESLISGYEECPTICVDNYDIIEVIRKKSERNKKLFEEYILGENLEDGIKGENLEDLIHVDDRCSKSVRQNASYADVLIGKIGNTHNGGCPSGVRRISLGAGEEPNSKSEGLLGSKIYGKATDTIRKWDGTEMIAPRPGARSNVQLRYFSFEPGTPVNNLVTNVWTVERLNNCIVGHFLGARMDYYDVRKEMFSQWESCGLEKIWCTENGIYLFKFKDTNRIDEILDEAHCHVFGKVMVLKRWHHMQKLSKEVVLKVPIWVKLYELPFEFLLGNSVGENLSKIDRRIGRPLYIDIAIEKGIRLSFARVCVEIDVSVLLPNTISIEYGGESMEVKVKYQWVPPKCEKYGAFGHRETYCPQNPIQSKQPKKLGYKLDGKTKVSEARNMGVGAKVAHQYWKATSTSAREESSDSDDMVTVLKEKKLVLNDKNSKKAAKGNLAKEKGHLKSGNSFAVLQSLQGEDNRPKVNRRRKENEDEGAPIVKNANLAMASSSSSNPEEGLNMFGAFVRNEEDIVPSEWGKSKRNKAAKRIDPP